MSTDDDGFTIIELLLSAAILAVIISAISGALIVFLSNGAYTTERDDHSGGAAVLASYLDRDLASADRYQLDAPSATCSAGDKDLLLSWDEWTATPSAVTPTPGQPYSAAYDLLSDGASGFRLERWYCAGSTQISHSVLVNDLAAADFANGPSGVACTTGSPLVVSLSAYAEDTGSDYRYSGCLKGRLK